MSVFRTRHPGLASLLRYVKGDEAHLRTFREDNGRVVFEFDDDGGEGAAVGNARALLDSHRKIRKAINYVTHNSGEWRNEKNG